MGKAWNGCTCHCHDPKLTVMHVVACCGPDKKPRNDKVKR